MAQTILVFAPHPDDAEFYAGGTLAKMADEGADIILVTVTSGNKGTFEYDAVKLAEFRAEEASKAGAVLGAKEVLFLGFADYELDRLPAGELRRHFIRLIRQYRPDAIFAFDPLGDNLCHPDHREVGRAAWEACSTAHLPLQYPEQLQEGLKPYFVPEKYYYGDDIRLMNRFFNIDATFGRKMEALAEHKTQVIFLVDEILLQAKQAGLPAEALGGQSHFDLLTRAMRQTASEIGKAAGCQLAEGFRYVRYNELVEKILEEKHE
ncbi:MAG TPA: PIG-L family deacetylase [Anaerolineaceae bacterium]|nr:PIG-L family deacetylase [Anaerolineaceae bacterium]HPN51137.1 PIG-L family deacetylase [Anaerolineaceae bacterium]